MFSLLILKLINPLVHSTARCTKIFEELVYSFSIIAIRYDFQELNNNSDNNKTLLIKAILIHYLYLFETVFWYVSYHGCDKGNIIIICE